ncbi:MAG: S41 family peptidase [Cellvibrionaceae bacterium]
MESGIRTIIFSILLVSIASCGGSGGGSGSNNNQAMPLSCSVINQNRFVLDVMEDIYLYYDQLPNINPSDYSSPEAMLSDLIVTPDRFSYIANQQAQQSFFEEGTYIGLGYGSEDDGNDAYVIRYVFDDSSAGRAGLQRSDRILAIDGVNVTNINNNGGFTSFINNYSEDDTLRYSVSSVGEAPRDIDLTIGLVTINTVISAEVINTNGLAVGYLALTSFLEPTKDELLNAFTTFAQANIDELVLDLRYNGGGRVTTAQRLSSLIAGSSAIGADTAKLVYNDKNSEFNTTFPFESLANSVDLNRLYVLTLNGTCSASELTINAMDPVNIDVITVGQTTCGKPVGSVGINFCEKTLNPIAFNVFNDLDQGDYFNGIEATCSATDDLNTLLADPSEGMLATALSHISNGQCPVTRTTTRDEFSQKNTEISFNIMESVH